MTEERYAAKLAEVDNLINNPDMPLCPTRIWQLMEEISEHAATEVDMRGDRSLPPYRLPVSTCVRAPEEVTS